MGSETCPTCRRRTRKRRINLVDWWQCLRCDRCFYVPGSFATLPTKEKTDD